MNGFMQKALAGLCLGGGSLITLVGCHAYREVVDPCWPERYNHQAQQSIQETFAAQTNNGHILDQTVWNWHFEAGTEKLNGAGLAHLQYLGRRRPAPDPRIFLQTALDLPPERSVEDRTKLDNARMQVVQNYLTAHTANRNLGFAFDVVVHDPADPSISAVPIGGTGKTAVEIPGAVDKLHGSFQGLLPQATGGAGGGAAGGSGGGR
jgi:hypothetical protein